MLEKDMEELIARSPKDFFPRNNFTLIGRQESFSGIGRYDLLFQDNRGTKILMELKARPAKYRDADQLAKYYDALKMKGEKNIILWLVATNIPHSVRELLDNIGIEHTEIHENEYYRVAERLGYKFILETNKTINNYNPIDNTVVKKINIRNNSMYRSKLSKDFRISLEKMGSFFETAHIFLTEIGAGQHEGFWLSTAKNAHLYYKEAYYTYIKLSFTKLELHSNFNGRIDSNSKDNSNKIFFGPIKEMIKNLDGFHEDWASIFGDGIILTNKAPSQFFEKLLVLIREVHK